MSGAEAGPATDRDGPNAATGPLLRLLAWFSPSFPVGAFSYSHGIEWAIEEGLLHDAAGLERWVADVLGHGAGRNDAILLAEAWRIAGDAQALADLRALAAAMPVTAELALETMAQGTAFARTAALAWGAGQEVEQAYPIAVGVAAAEAGLPLQPTLIAYLHAFAANLVSAALRAVPLGQTDGQRTLRALEPVIVRQAALAAASSLDDLGSATLMVDWCSMRHETQYTRLFRS